MTFKKQKIRYFINCDFWFSFD